MEYLADAVMVLIPIVSVIAVFTFLAIAVWAKQRRRERESYYRHELIKGMVDKGVEEERILSVLEGDARLRRRRLREGLRLGGIITSMVGIGWFFGFQFIEDEAVWMLGALPLAIGLGLLLGSYLVGSEPRSAEG